jgi:hypothetical protein
MREFILEIFKLLETQFTRKQKEQQEFMEFYEFLVKNIPEKVAIKFGNLGKIQVKRYSHSETFGLELNVIDYGWWLEKIKMGYVITDPNQVKLEILNRLASMVEVNQLSEEDKNKFLSYLKK